MKELSLVLFIALASGLCWAITADLAVSNGGGFSFSPNSGSHFEPALFDAGWGRCRAFGGWSDDPRTTDEMMNHIRAGRTANTFPKL